MKINYLIQISISLISSVYASSACAALPIQSWVTHNGARVLFVQANTIPILDIQIDFDAGARFDPKNKSGLAEFTQNLLGRSTQKLTETQIEERWADFGAIRGGGASMDRTSYTLRVLTDPVIRGPAIELFAETLQYPHFDEAILTREKNRTIAALREAEIKPEYIAERRFYSLLYGVHPYASHPTVESIQSITRADIETFYFQTHRASRAVISMIGAIDRRQAETIAEQLIHNLPGDDSKLISPLIPQSPMATHALSEYIAHPAQQSHILIGLPALARGDPDFFALTVGNYILGGGGFVSRLTSEIREKRGLAYSAYSYFVPMLQAGPFIIGMQTQRDQTQTALKVINQTVTEFLTTGPTPQELAAAKKNLIGGFALRIDSNRKILEQIATIGFYRLPLDYLDHWVEKVNQVTLAEIRSAFARKVKPEQWITVVVGAVPDQKAP